MALSTAACDQLRSNRFLLEGENFVFNECFRKTDFSRYKYVNPQVPSSVRVSLLLNLKIVVYFCLAIQYHNFSLKNNQEPTSDLECEKPISQNFRLKREQKKIKSICLGTIVCK